MPISGAGAPTGSSDVGSTGAVAALTTSVAARATPAAPAAASFVFSFMAPSILPGHAAAAGTGVAAHAFGVGGAGRAADHPARRARQAVGAGLAVAWRAAAGAVAEAVVRHHPARARLGPALRARARVRAGAAPV